ncbi:uncharacterized protein F4807DRAFT_458732 [Annulohypoxylon truncatum]|uniref:uncharacterized protein n=1 Tax=Annulohypoxylon truncatum TaxID=327061 RepID=UPI0020073AE8|nr:uncharacterized protein F4807DRAFT_458732 [Annulohypoxylon truncatum]KAI1211160.1 hypothetical protein F4807DRAFT_458732 [Annulohypoxylon truncatum]
MAINKKTKVAGKKLTHNRLADPAVPNAFGRILQNGLYECRVPVGGRRCGAQMLNAKHNIRSHISKKHRDDSAYKKNQRAGIWPCVNEDCVNEGRIYPNFHSLVGHARSVHGMKGDSKPLKQRATNLRRKMAEKERREMRDAEREAQENASDDAEYEEESLFVEQPDEPDGPSGGNFDRDPPGTGGSQPIPVA